MRLEEHQFICNSFDVDGQKAVFGRLPINVHYAKQYIPSRAYVTFTNQW